MAKIKLDKYYTEDYLAEYCVQKTFEILGNDWNRVIEPAAGGGAYLKYLPEDTLAFDILPEHPKVIQQDYLKLELPYMEKSLVITNPPFGRANKLSVQFMIKSLEHSDFVSFIQPISQLNQNRTMKNTTLVYSEDLGVISYSGRPVHCCLNIYKKSDEENAKYEIPGIYGRHIFRQGKYQHDDSILNYAWDFRVSAWGKIELLPEGKFADNEIVFRVDDPTKYEWLKNKLQICDYNKLLNYVTSPNMPIWRLKKWLHEEYAKDFPNN